MATYTPNLNLGKPESTDPFGDFRQLFNDNMDILDNGGGGGGGGGGHTIIDQSGNSMPNRTGLQFIGASVTDDSVNNKTVVTVTGGGGGVHYSTTEQVIGTWIDGKPLYERVLELTQDTNLTANTWVKTEFNQTTMKALIKAVAVIGLSGAVIEALSGGFIDGKIALNSARNVGLNVADSARLIVQYTKTTD